METKMCSWYTMLYLWPPAEEFFKNLLLFSAGHIGAEEKQFKKYTSSFLFNEWVSPRKTFRAKTPLKIGYFCGPRMQLFLIFLFWPNWPFLLLFLFFTFRRRKNAHKTYKKQRACWGGRTHNEMWPILIISSLWPKKAKNRCTNKYSREMLRKVRKHLN